MGHTADHDAATEASNGLDARHNSLLIKRGRIPKPTVSVCDHTNCWLQAMSFASSTSWPASDVPTELNQCDDITEVKKFV